VSKLSKKSHIGTKNTRQLNLRSGLLSNHRNAKIAGIQPKENVLMNARLLIPTLTAVLLSFGAFAQTSRPTDARQKATPEERQERRKQFQSRLEKMSPDERQAFRRKHHQKQQERMSQLSPEQRQAYREARQQRMKERYEAMTPRQQQEFRERMQQRRARHEKHRNG